MRPDAAGRAQGGEDAPVSTSDDTATIGFASLGLRPELLRSLVNLGYEEPTPIQREAIPPLLEGRDLLGQAATGTGKTAAFALPLLHRLADQTNPGGTYHHAPRGLVLVPTRELAMQVSEAIHKYGRELGTRVLPVYGGQPIVRQLQALSRGVDVVVATPGRAVDHLRRGSLPLDAVQVVVLDEADEMLDMGFAEDIEALLGATTGNRQTVLFSATLPARIGGIARRHLRNPVRIEIGRPVSPTGGRPLVRQTAYMVARAHKPAALGRILDVEGPAAALVFCRTRNEVDQLTETLNGRGYRAEALHGGMDQAQRDRVMGRLRAGTADLLIATDVAARGLDIEQLSHVVNYDVPSAPETYVHRIGRIGRAGREGVAITLAEPREHRLLKNIERLVGEPIPVDKVPTSADLRSRRLELTLATLRTAIDHGDLDHFRVVVETLSDDYDLVEIALAAVKLAHEATGGGEDEADIPNASEPSSGSGPRRNDARSGSTESRGGSTKRPQSASSGPRVRLYINAGRSAGIRPADLVGAIANETRLSGRDIGPIEIAERFSLVEVPEDAADEVIAAVNASTIKGKKTSVRRER
jgi:ATP-dependent RNA helicase DeaD